MEDLSPTIILLWEIKRSLERGQSVQNGIKSYLSIKKKDGFYPEVELWWLSQNNQASAYNKSKLYMTRKCLLEILEVGLSGHSILETLKVFERELIQNCEDEIQAHLAHLPLILMIPLMCMIFPALMLLLIGPLMSAFAF